MASLGARIPLKGTPWAMPILLVLAVAWGCYVLYRAREAGTLARWGLRAPWNVGAWRVYSGLTAVGLAGIALPALLRGDTLGAVPTPAAWALYAAWALAQQFALQNVFAAGLRTLGAGPWLTPIAASVVFGLAHVPDWRLGAFAALGGVVWVAAWPRYPNLWLAAASHAVVGTACVVWLFHRDPAGEFIQFLDRYFTT